MGIKDWGSLFAGMVIVLVPTVLVYSLLQKRLAQGMMMGGVKGERDYRSSHVRS